MLVYYSIARDLVIVKYVLYINYIQSYKSKVILTTYAPFLYGNHNYFAAEKVDFYARNGRVTNYVKDFFKISATMF